MQEKVLKLLSQCMQAKEIGHDVFFSYYPHVRAIDIKVYEGGWTRKADNEPNPPTRSAEFYLDYADANDKADKTIEYLKELIANVG